VIVSGDAGAVLGAKRRLLKWHDQFSRFNADSELSRLNRDPRATVPVSPMMGRIVAAALDGAERTGGLIDPTLVDQIEGRSECVPEIAIEPEFVVRDSTGPALGQSLRGTSAVTQQVQGSHPSD